MSVRYCLYRKDIPFTNATQFPQFPSTCFHALFKLCTKVAILKLFLKIFNFYTEVENIKNKQKKSFDVWNNKEAVIDLKWVHETNKNTRFPSF